MARRRVDLQIVIGDGLFRDPPPVGVVAGQCGTTRANLQQRDRRATHFRTALQTTAPHNFTSKAWSAELLRKVLQGRAGSPLPAERRAQSDTPYLCTENEVGHRRKFPRGS